MIAGKPFFFRVASCSLLALGFLGLRCGGLPSAWAQPAQKDAIVSPQGQPQDQKDAVVPPVPAAEVPRENSLPNAIEYILDMSQQGIPLPKIFSPCVDVGGRGFHGDVTWPQALAAPAVFERWQKEAGFRGVYRLQFNLWEISQLDKNKTLQGKLLANYESVIKRISDSGGIVILDIYGTPEGQGKVLDKTSFPVDFVAFKQQVKEYIRYFSCLKKYNVWYEVWSAPDLDDFFLGRKNEYLQMYRCVAEAVKELQAETKSLIPVGGPSTSWWFRSFEESTVLTPERSLIYELIRFCYHNKLPLDFISWHAYSSDPQAERERTAYDKTPPNLIRDWLSYFGFPRETPLIIDEWNFDSGVSNVLEERYSKGNVGASYLMSRLKNMYEAGLDYQVFFSLEDFQENREGVVRNVGAFWYDQSHFTYTGGSKNIFDAFRFLGCLGDTFLPQQQKTADEFAGAFATRGESGYAVIAYNYIDPDITRNSISRSIALLNDTERRDIFSVMNSDKTRLETGGAQQLSARFSGKVKNLLKRAQESAVLGERFKSTERQLLLTIKNMSSPFILQKYSIDDSCFHDCPFLPEEKEISPDAAGMSHETVTLKPYSVALILLKPKPVVIQKEAQEVSAQAPAGGAPEKAPAQAGTGNAADQLLKQAESPASVSAKKPIQGEEAKPAAAQPASGQGEKH